MATARPIGIYYEHPDWFRPLFTELDRRGVTYEALNADRHAYDATNGDGSQYGLVFNRMSPSAYLRGRGHSILYTLNYLAHLEQLGVRVVNGLTAFRTETSKALQLSLLKSLRSEEHTSELQSLAYLVCRLLLEKKKNKN